MKNISNAFLIVVHKNPEHVKRIIEKLNVETNSFFIHLDKKADIKEFEYLKDISEYNNIHFTSPQYDHRWGSGILMRIIIDLLTLAKNTAHFDFYHVIDVASYPILSVTEMNRFLENNKDNNFFEYYPLLPVKSTKSQCGVERFEVYYFYHLAKPNKIHQRINYELIRMQVRLGVKRKFLSNKFSKFYWGQGAFTLNNNATNYILNFFKENPSFFKSLKYTFAPEEFFIQTLLVNSPLKDTIKSTTLRYILHEYKNGNNPAILDESDFLNIKNSDALFIRKVDPIVSEKLLEKIDNELLNDHQVLR